MQFERFYSLFDGKKLKSSPWGIDVLCEYVGDECEPTHVWCQGKVVELVRQTDTEAVVKIEWNETCLQHGDQKVTKHVLKKLKWNLMTKDAWKTNQKLALLRNIYVHKVLTMERLSTELITTVIRPTQAR